MIIQIKELIIAKIQIFKINNYSKTEMIFLIKTVILLQMILIYKYLWKTLKILFGKDHRLRISIKIIIKIINKIYKNIIRHLIIILDFFQLNIKIVIDFKHKIIK